MGPHKQPVSRFSSILLILFILLFICNSFSVSQAGNTTDAKEAIWKPQTLEQAMELMHIGLKHEYEQKGESLPTFDLYIRSFQGNYNISQDQKILTIKITA